MQCPKCGYLMSSFDAECARCKNLGTGEQSHVAPDNPQSGSPPAQQVAAASSAPLGTPTITQTKRSPILTCGAIFFGIIFFFFILNAILYPGSEPAAPFAVITHTQNMVSLDQYNQIQYGMTYEQVSQIIGSPGTLSASSHLPSYGGVTPEITDTMYSWQNGDGSNMNAMFQNDSLTSKAQAGLR